MSIKIMTRVWDEADVSGSTLLVLLALADWANDDGWCWPKIETIAAKARITDRHASRVLADLEQRKLIQREPQGRGTRYRVTLNRSPDILSTNRNDHLTSASGSPDICDNDHLTSAPSIEENRQVVQPSVEPSGRAARPDSALFDAESQQPKAKRRKPETPLPETWEPTAEHKTFAHEQHLDLDHEAAQFRDHHLARDSRMRDWDRAFWTWLRNSAKWRKQHSGSEEKPIAGYWQQAGVGAPSSGAVPGYWPGTA
jgi:hypothetical protein